MRIGVVAGGSEALHGQLDLCGHAVVTNHPAWADMEPIRADRRSDETAG
jgi:hypothetical protein